MGGVESPAMWRRRTLRPGPIALMLAFGTMVLPSARAADAASVAPAPDPAGSLAYEWAGTPSSPGGGAPMGIGVARPDGTGDRHVTDGEGGLDYRPAWSPDGSQIAFEHDPQSQTPSLDDIEVVPADDSAAPAVVGQGFGVAWAPDWKHVAYASGTPSGNGWDLHVVIAPVTGTYEHPVIDTANALTVPGTDPGGGSAGWSADGQSLLYSTEPAPAQPDSRDLWRINADGSGRQLLAAGLALYGGPQWSPDDSHVAFIEGPQPNSSLWVVNTDGTGLHKVDGYSLSFSWNPTGVMIGVATGGGLDVVGLDGSKVVANMMPSPEWSYQDLSWTADGTHLLYGAYTPPVGYSISTNIFTVGLDGSDHHTVVPDGNVVTGNGYEVYSPGTVLRVAGPDRDATSASVSQRCFASASAAVLSRDDTYADALGAGPLAASVGGPLLLNPTSELDPRVGAELQRLGVHTVYLMGGPAGLGDAVVQGLQAMGISDIRRVAGTDRFSTAAAAASSLTSSMAYVVDGADPDSTRGWPDAIAASGLASYQHSPILLVTPDSLPDATRTALQADHISHVTIIGGTSVVSQSVADQIAALGISTARTAGADRYSTSAELATQSTNAGMDPHKTVVAAGTNWPDSLSAGPCAAEIGASLLLVPSDQLTESSAAQSWLASYATQFQHITLVGGLAAVSAIAATQVEYTAD